MSLSKKDILYAFLILLFSYAIALIYNHFSKSGIPLFCQNNDENNAVIIAINDPEIVKFYMTEENSVIIDARSEALFREGHIKRAISCPFSNFEKIINDLKNTISKTQNIVVYCSNIHCSDSHFFAEQLIKKGYFNVRIYPAGFNEWKEIGYPVQR